MSKRAHNHDKAEGLIKSVHAGQLPGTHPAAQRLIGQLPSLIEWSNELSVSVFRPNPLIRDELSIQTRAEDQAKGSPWFSGYVQPLAGNIATKVAAVEKQLYNRLMTWLHSCDQLAQPKRVRKRDRDKPQPPRQIYTHVPMNVQDQATQADFKVLKELVGDKFKKKTESPGVPVDSGEAETVTKKKSAKPTRWRIVCADVRSAMLVAADGGLTPEQSAELGVAACAKHGLNAVQAAILVDICTRAFERYSCPELNKVGPNGTDRFVLRLELDARGYADTEFRNKPEVFREHVTSAMEEAWLCQEKVFRYELNVVDLENRRGHACLPLKIPVEIHRGVWNVATRSDLLALTGSSPSPTIGNICLEIGKDHVNVKANIRLPRRTPDVAKTSKQKVSKLDDAYFDELAASLNAREVFLGRDIGMVNTTSHAAVCRDRLVTAEELRAATAITKTTAFEYLSTHSHPAEPMEVNGEAVLSHNCGRAFLNCIANHALHIDALRAEIDDNYKRMKTYKLILLKPLGLESVKERIPDCYRSMPGRPATATHPDPYNQDLIGKFFRILDLTLKLKEIRREIYRKIAAVKKCWFGWLSTQEAKLALRLNAAVVREDTDFIAIPNDDPKYRGRTFNRLLNNGSRGQYERAASHKLAWLGIPEVRIPSFYTSMADVRKAVIEAFRRKGEVFTDVDGVVWHADEHAALTIAVWLLLRPLSIAMTGGASTSAIPA